MCMRACKEALIKSQEKEQAICNTILISISLILNCGEGQCERRNVRKILT